MTRYGSPVWIDGASNKTAIEAPRLRGARSTSIVVIGGGLTGCCVAYACSAAGLKVMLVEADRLGRGASGRGDGVARGEPALSFRALEKRLGRRAARAMFDASRRAVLDLGTALRRLAPRSPFELHDALRMAGPVAADQLLQKECAARADAGLDAVWLKASRAATDAHAPTTGAMRLKGWARLDPAALPAQFAKAAAARGAHFFERSPVRKVRALARQVEVVTEGGTISADTVIVCTGEPTDLFRPLKRHFRFAERYVAVTEVVPAALRRQLFDTLTITDMDTPPHLIGRVGDRLLIAGADQPRGPARAKDKRLVQRTGQLMYELSRLYPAISGIQPSYGWELPLAHSADEVMVAGPHRNYPRHLFAFGTGHDPGQAFLASRILLRHVQGGAARDDRFFSFTRG